MAYIDLKKSRPTGGGGAAPAAAAPGAAPAGGAPQAANQQPAAAAQPQRTPGTGFTNLSNILRANQAGAQQMGQKLVGNVQQQGQAAQAAIQAGQQAYASKAQQGTLQYQPGTITTPAPGIVPSYQEVHSMEGAAAQAGERAKTQYAGPKDWAEAGVNEQDLARQAATAQDSAKALGSMGGRAALLRKDVSGPYGGTGAALDAYLAGQGMGAAGQQAVATFGNLSQLLAEARGQSKATYDEAVKTTAENAAKYGADAARYTDQARRMREDKERADEHRRNHPFTPIDQGGGGVDKDWILKNPGLLGSGRWG